MVRSRVLSFISAFGAPIRQLTPDPPKSPRRAQSPADRNPQNGFSPADGSSGPSNPSKSNRSSTRPLSMAITYQPPKTDTTQDTLPELLPVFTFLNTHANKLYQEGYFLKLSDLDIHGRPCSDRQWVECFAQLVGTILSLWDAAALAAAGEDGEVAPTFINLADASVKMIETLPTRNQSTNPLQNVLSISTAGKNRYLLHFDSLHSLTQWTAGIRLSLFEHASLLEAYTGSIIAGKGKTLNNIRTIMERCRFKQEDWARVRFGAGTPWRRCWCVITPPDEKEIQKAQKKMKKRSAYDRTTPLLTGDIKFYETKKTKKVQPIATITNAYSAYAIYPQSKPLIDQSTLVKIEGEIKIHAQSGSATEGFVFVMPELHPAVSGFEMMLRFLFPAFDTFGLYGRPTRLIADTNNVKSLMFAFPKEKWYGYLDVLDVANLIQNMSGSENWPEKEWRKQLRQAAAERMSSEGSRASSVSGHTQLRSHLSPHGPVTRFADSDENIVIPTGRPNFYRSADDVNGTPAQMRQGEIMRTSSQTRHTRSASDSLSTNISRPAEQSYTSTHLSVEQTFPVLAAIPPAPPLHIEMPSLPDLNASNESSDTDSDRNIPETPQADLVRQDLRLNEPPAPVIAPPAFAHHPQGAPVIRPQASLESQRASHRMSISTLAQIAEVGKMSMAAPVEASSEFQGVDRSERLHPDAGFLEVNPDERGISPKAPVIGPSERVADMPPPAVPLHSPISPVHLHIDTDKAQETAKSIKRKPVNSRPTSYPAPSPVDHPSASTPSSLRHTFDESAMNRVMTRHSTFTTDPDLREDDGSVYNDESATPDYASTRKSTDTKRSDVSAPRTRMGVMKTVGGSELEKQEFKIGDAHYLATDRPPTVDPEIPAVDFGPTMAYLPNVRRPSLSDDLKRISKSNVDLEHRRHSHAWDEQLAGDHVRHHSISPARNERRKSAMAWQPGLAARRPQTASGLVSPQQFVHQRVASNPRVDANIYANRRGSSTPPAQRPQSGDWTAYHTRHQHGRESPVRPQSRGAWSNLNGHNEMTDHLSAREREHVARITGSSFLNMSTQTVRTQAPVNPGGLVSAIDARERERRDIKEGVSNHMVQYAIAQRQQQYWESQQGQYRPPSQGQYRAPQQYPRDPNLYNQSTAGGNWDAMSQMTSMPPPMHGRVSPNWSGQYSPQSSPASAPYQNQYFPPNPSQNHTGQRLYR